jgi:hypothetical protein
MTQKAFAIVAVWILIATLTAGAVAAQDSSQALPTSICSTGDLNDVVGVFNFDSPTYKNPESVPAGVRSYLSDVLTKRLQACAAQAGPAACTPAKGERDPRALWRQLQFCEGLVGLKRPKAREPLVAAQEPTFYVLLAIGAGTASPPAASSPAKSGGGGAGGGASSGGKGGAATGSTATGSTLDSPNSFLLFLIAQRLERDMCSRSGVSLHDCDAQHPVAVIPEASWNLEDLRAQCQEDPYVPNDPTNPYGSQGQRTPAGHGTLGAIAINGSTVTADGTFAVVTVYGSSEANYAAQAVDCRSGAGAPLATVWSDNISNGNKTTALSFFPIALAGAILTAHWAARSAALPAPNPSSSPNVLSSFINYQTDIALGTFAANTSGLTLGNPSSGLTFRHTFEAYANALADNLNAFCTLQASQNVCKALKLPKSP